jgi:O-antigen biosynthesis alpha-1,3-mannosyltransferase
MKIVFDHMELGRPNGNSTYSTGLIKGLATEFQDNEYHLFTYWRRKKRTQDVVGNIPAIKVDNILPHPLILGKMFRPAVKKLNARLLRCATKRSDIYHCTNPEYFTFGISNPVVTILDLIALQKEDWVAQCSKDFYYKNIARIISEVGAIFTISNHTRTDILHHFPEAKDKIIVTYLGVDDRFHYLPGTDRTFLNAYGYPKENPPFLLYAGETQPRKNIHGLITAFAEVPLTIRKKMHLVIVGSSRRRNYREVLFSLVQKKNLQDIVHFYTDVSHDDLVKFYNAAHAFVFPSFYEGFGLPVAEAMKCGCPVVTSTASSLPEVGGDAALYVDPNDVYALKEKLRQIIEDDGLRRSLREKGFAQAAKFTWKKTAELTYGAYRKV